MSPVVLLSLLPLALAFGCGVAVGWLGYHFSPGMRVRRRLVQLGRRLDVATDHLAKQCERAAAERRAAACTEARHPQRGADPGAIGSTLVPWADPWGHVR